MWLFFFFFFFGVVVGGWWGSFGLDFIAFFVLFICVLGRIGAWCFFFLSYDTRSFFYIFFFRFPWLLNVVWGFDGGVGGCRM
jgi:hypothetical protein